MSARRRILLTCLPAPRGAIRDYYCSNYAKARYYWTPLDMVVLSARLPSGCEVHFRDAVPDRWRARRLARYIREHRVDTMIALVGAITWEHDVCSLRAIRRACPGLRIVVTGDVCLELGHEILARHPEIDAALLSFLSPSLDACLQGSSGGEPENAVIRLPDGRTTGARRSIAGRFTMGIPRHELFTSKRYYFPTMMSPRYANVLTNYGCRHGCEFCIAPRLGFALREEREVLEELEYVGRLGVREAFFRDYTFGAVRSHAVRVLEGMLQRGLSIRWSCLTRADVVADERFTRLMKRAGCHTVQIGVESASNSVLRFSGKGQSVETVEQAVAVCRRAGIRVMTYVILGLRGETERTVLRTIERVKQWNPYLASFNVLSPRIGSSIRQSLLDRDELTPDCLDVDSSVRRPVCSVCELSPEQLHAWRTRAMVSYFCRWRYLRTAIGQVGSPANAARSARTAVLLLWDVLRQWIRSRADRSRSVRWRVGAPAAIAGGGRGADGSTCG